MRQERIKDPLYNLRGQNEISLRSKRFLASSSRKLGREQKKKNNFRVVTRLETLATQARMKYGLRIADPVGGELRI